MTSQIPERHLIQDPKNTSPMDNSSQLPRRLHLSRRFDRRTA